MHILFVLENYYPGIGGVETLFKSLITDLNHRGIRTTIITTNKHHLDSVEQDNLCTIRRYNFFNRYLFTFLALFPILKYGQKVDLIHSTSYNAGLPASLAGILLRKKTIITFHEVWGKLWFRLPYFNIITKYLHYLFEQLLLKMPFHLFIAVSKFTANRLIKYGVSTDRVKMIYNGIVYNKWKASFNRSKNKNYHYIFFGRLGISKGINLLIDAYRHLVQQHKNIQLTLVLSENDNKFLKILQDKINQIPDENKPIIHFKLSHDELVHKIGLADAVVIPSYSEGFGFTAVESMALGKPIISSGRGALKEVIGGNFIEMENLSIEALSNAMEHALLNKWEFRPPTHFPLRNTVDKYVALYEDILKKEDDRR